jgi:predicted TIM-barrel fold metal-dependent hydrolase
MTAAGVSGTLVVQPVNYGQDYSYMENAFRQFPGFFRGMFVADPNAEDPVGKLRELASSSPGFWVGVRFNPYKWTDAAMADDVGQKLFMAAGELGLPVGFMPFKGLRTHIDAIETLMKNSPSTAVIIDHWGFHVQPATGFGDDRVAQTEHWEDLLRLGKEYPQVHVKLSGAFRNSLQPLPFSDLETRLEQLVATFSTKRLLWGTDAPYFLDHGGYADAIGFLSSWPSWQRLDEQQRSDILHGTCERLFGAWREVVPDGSQAEL